MSEDEQAHAGDALTGHREQIALVDALIQEKLDEWEEGGTKELWRALVRAVQKMRRARSSGDKHQLREALGEIERLVVRGGEQTERRQELMKLLALRGKLAERETRRKLMEEQTIPIDQFNAAFQAMWEIVRRHVLNAALEPEETLLAIENDWGAVTSGVQGESTPGSPS